MSLQESMFDVNPKMIIRDLKERGINSVFFRVIDVASSNEAVQDELIKEFEKRRWDVPLLLL